MAGKDFDGFVVLVTGGSTGLGRAIAVETASRGAAAVIINYASSKAEAEETARLCEAEGAKAVLVQGDVGEDAGQCRRFVRSLTPRFDPGPAVGDVIGHEPEQPCSDLVVGTGRCRWHESPIRR